MDNMSRHKRSLTAPPSGSNEHLDSIKPSVSISEPVLKISLGDRKKSMTPSLRSRGSGSGGPTLGVSSARRFSRRMSTRAPIKREDTQGSSLNLQSVSLRQEPTYKMAPEVKFSARSVEDIIKETLHRSLENYTYDKRQTPTFGKILSDDIKDRVKRLNFDRYKIVCLLVIGEQQGQGLQMSSRCQWFPDTDTFASYTFKNSDIFCACTVYGIYAEWFLLVLAKTWDFMLYRYCICGIVLGIAKFNLLIIVIMKVCRQDVSRFAYTVYVIRQERFEIRTFIYTRYHMFHPTTCILDIRGFFFSISFYPFTYVIKPKVLNHM